MSTLRQAAQQALEALKSAAIFVDSFRGQKATQEAITALQAALEQPEQEPVISAWSLREVYFDADGEPLMHRSPPAAQRQWIGLTPEEVLDLFDVNNVYGSKWIEFARTVEAKLKERNT